MNRIFLGIIRYGVLSVKKRLYWEMQLFALIRDPKDGIHFFKFHINWTRYKSDHTPSFEIEIIFLNLYNSFSIHQNNHEYEE